MTQDKKLRMFVEPDYHRNIDPLGDWDGTWDDTIVDYAKDMAQLLVKKMKEEMK